MMMNPPLSTHHRNISDYFDALDGKRSAPTSGEARDMMDLNLSKRNTSVYFDALLASLDSLDKGILQIDPKVDDVRGRTYT
jgi:hypothetical protein